MVEEFFNQPQLVHRPPPAAFKFGDMRSELEGMMEHQRPGMQDWAKEFQAGPMPGRMEDPEMMRAFEEHFRGPVPQAPGGECRWSRGSLVLRKREPSHGD